MAAPRPASFAPADAGARETEFDFSPSDFERVRKLIFKKAGISLNAGKQAMVYSRLSRRMRELGHRSCATYLQTLEAGHGAAADDEWQEFVNCLTTNLTFFFREAHHFPVLAAELSRRRGQPVRIWCNAASTGEEPYSIAMTVIETLGPNAAVEIICSDIDTKVLAEAGRGVYPQDARGLPADKVHRHFLRGAGANIGRIRVKPELTRLLRFRAMNLMDARWSMGEPFDIVFCRNVMIYFDAPTQRGVLERMHGAMAEGSCLFAGHSENFGTSADLFRLRAQTVYERVRP